MSKLRTHIRSSARGPRTRLSLAAITVGLLAFAGLAAAPTYAAAPANTAPAYAAPAATGILSDSLKPTTVSDSDRFAVELGIRFSPTASGKVTALQYYQGPNAKGVNTATLWSKGGRVLAQKTFATSSTVGWRTIPLSTPVTLTAGETYVASYGAPKGRYPVSEHAFTSPKVENGFKLTASAGVYRYGKTSKVPDSSYRGSNYLVDVVFTPSSSDVKPSATPKPATEPKPTTSPKPTVTPKPTTPPVTLPKPTTTVKPSTPAPSTPAPTTPTPTTPTPTTPTGGFPTATTAGIPAGSTPKTTVTGDYWVRTAGAVVEDLKISNGTIYVAAENVTLRRINGANVSVLNYNNGTCYNGLTIEDSSFVTTGRTDDSGEAVIGPGGYTLRNVLVDGAPEGLRVGGQTLGCGAVTVQDTFVRITSPQVCGDWHGDGLQGYGGAALVVRNSTMIMNETNGCYGTAPFFYPQGQGNTSVDIDGLLVSGGGYSFRNGMPGTVTNLTSSRTAGATARSASHAPLSRSGRPMSSS
ncbi:DUF4082 domain-containing protein [Microbacterium sp. CH12i]|uniref:DUF4082 domain-containing protein n=1 Tax=Microbacterium sp. CH12i TaxID=1479651 RepID=UPI0006923BE6|nr:DUF4082 domain-containing protein [Microbacterium sp. CH12i]